MKRYLCPALAAILAATVLVSCDDEPGGPRPAPGPGAGPGGNDPAATWYPSGTWELIEDSYGQVTEADVVEYTFYSSGTGIYGYYTGYGYNLSWTEDPMNWDAWYDTGVGQNVLSVSTPGGTQQYTYNFDSYGYLYLYVWGYPSDYYIFQPI
ncbi:MAG: hypothetical protein NC117_10105 [Pseudoflavonifractor sp.]|nr:hypothetical protein [Pseudoflavonifractor sp.]